MNLATVGSLGLPTSAGCPPLGMVSLW